MSFIEYIIWLASTSFKGIIIGFFMSKSTINKNGILALPNLFIRCFGESDMIVFDFKDSFFDTAIITWVGQNKTWNWPAVIKKIKGIKSLQPSGSLGSNLVFLLEWKPLPPRFQSPLI